MICNDNGNTLTDHTDASMKDMSFMKKSLDVNFNAYNSAILFLRDEL